MLAAVNRKYPADNRLRNGQQVCQPRLLRLVVEHHMKLARKDEHADTREHSVDYSGRHRAKPLPDAKLPGNELQQSRDHQNRTKSLDALVANQFPNQNG